jgi:hypothetical protein
VNAETKEQPAFKVVDEYTFAKQAKKSLNKCLSNLIAAVSGTGKEWLWWNSCSKGPQLMS